MATRFIPNPGIEAALAAAAPMRDELVERAEAIKERAEAKAPRLTGALAASGQVDPIFEGLAWRARVTFTVPYAVYVEYGTNDTPAQPFLRPAADEVIG